MSNVLCTLKGVGLWESMTLYINYHHLLYVVMVVRYSSGVHDCKLLYVVVQGHTTNLQPEGNIAMDRFKSLQRRNMIEPRQMIR